MAKVLAEDTIRNSFFNEMVHENDIKIDSEEKFNDINEKLGSSIGFQLKLKKIFQKNMTSSFGVGESVRKAIRASICTEFLLKLGWTGSNCVKFQGTRFCNLLLGKF